MTTQKLRKAFKKLQSSGIPLLGGNCGMVAIAVLKYVDDPKIQVAITTNVEEEEDLLEEPNIYHVFLMHNGKAWDGKGLVSTQYIADWVEAEYGNSDPALFTFDYAEIDKVQTIVRRETNWTTDWVEFYSILQQ